MNACDYNPYELPTITFVGGETRDLAFHIYHYIGKRPYSLSECECTFSLVNFTTKGGKPILSKEMTVIYDETGTIDNVLTVTLESLESVNLFGKYIYQITIQDRDGEVEIPSQGIMYINNNIDKGIIRCPAIEAGLFSYEG